MNECALRRLFLGIVYLLLTAYCILGARHSPLRIALPAMVFSRTDHGPYWIGSLSIHGSLILKLQDSDRSFSGKIAVPGYAETSQQQFTGSMLLHRGKGKGHGGWLIHFQEGGSDTGDTFILGRVFTRRKLNSFSMALTAPGATQRRVPGSPMIWIVFSLPPAPLWGRQLHRRRSRGLLPLDRYLFSGVWDILFLTKRLSLVYD